MNKLSVVLTLCFSGLGFVAETSFANTKQSNTYSLTDVDMEIVRKSEAYMGLDLESNKHEKFEINLDEFINKNAYRAAQGEARQLVDQIKQANPNPMLTADMQESKPEPKPYTDHSTLVFASLSLGEQGLNDLLAMSVGIDDAVVVFQGIPAGEGLTQAMGRLQKLAAQHSPPPNIIINPDLFRSYKVTSVPTVIITKETDMPIAGEVAEPKARVAGISDPNWLSKAVERGEVGDLGVRGPVEEISEVDFIELAQQRASQIDWEQKKENAQAGYWQNQSFNELPKAPRPRMRDFDPSVIITSDIKAQDGTIVSRKGDVINPLDIRDFTQAVIVFDPLDKKQLELVAQELPRIKKTPGVGYVTMIATRLDKEDGWKSYESVSDYFDEPIYLLTPDVMSRFELEYVPSVITSKGRLFQIEELHNQ